MRLRHSFAASFTLLGLALFSGATLSAADVTADNLTVGVKAIINGTVDPGVPSGNQTNIGFGIIRTSGDISGKNATLTGATINGSLANDYLFKVKNTDLTGRGIRSQVGVDTYSALAVRNALDTLITFDVLGNGTTTISGVAPISVASNQVVIGGGVIRTAGKIYASNGNEVAVKSQDNAFSKAQTIAGTAPAAPTGNKVAIGGGVISTVTSGTLFQVLNSTNAVGGYIEMKNNGITKGFFGYGATLFTNSGVGIRTEPSVPFSVSIGGAVPALTVDGAAPLSVAANTVAIGGGYIRAADTMMVDNGTVKVMMSQGASTGYIGTQSNHNLNIRTNNVDRMIVDAAGYVGIGTTPTAKMVTIAGEIQLTGYPTGVIFGNSQALKDNGGAGLQLSTFLNNTDILISPKGMLKLQPEAGYVSVYGNVPTTPTINYLNAGEVRMGGGKIYAEELMAGNAPYPLARVSSNTGYAWIAGNVYYDSVAQVGKRIQAGGGGIVDIGVATGTDGSLAFRTWGNGAANTTFTWDQPQMTISHNAPTSVNPGEVRIGEGRVMVGGTLSAKEIKVTTDGADYVFDDAYRLRPLIEVEQFIKDNRHLPEIPSAKVMQEDGLSVSEIVTKQLAKIEELTLYAIQAERDKQALADKADRLEKTLATVLVRLSAVETLIQDSAK